MPGMKEGAETRWQFTQYLHQRSILLESEDLSPEQRQALGRAIMQEEDDWLDWKVAWEMLDSGLGLRQEVTTRHLGPRSWVQWEKDRELVYRQGQAG